MPIYKVTNKSSGQCVAVQANNRTQALNFLINQDFEAGTMSAEEVMVYMESGQCVKDARPTAAENTPVDSAPTPEPESDAPAASETQEEGTE